MPRWMLQPHNYSQIQHRNLYDVAYLRTGAYKGMGHYGTSGLGQPHPFSSATSDTSLIDPSASDPNAPTYVLADFPTGGGGGAAPPTSPTSYLPWIIGGGLLLVLLLAGRR